MQWVASKLTRPIALQSFNALQKKYPDSALTQIAGSFASAEQPMAPDGSGENPLQEKGAIHRHSYVEGRSDSEEEGAVSARRRQSIKAKAEAKAKNYLLKKVLNLLWSQICLPLTIALWSIKCLFAMWEERCENAAKQLKPFSQHTADVARVAAQLRNKPAGSRIVLADRGGRAHSSRPASMKQSSVGPLAASLIAQSSSSASGAVAYFALDLSRLDGVLAIDANAMTCVVEPQCTFRTLLRALAHVRVMPLVVPPFPTMTIGGAFIGDAISSSSFRYGNFGASVIEVDVLLPSGEKVTASADGGNSELFHALIGSYHTVGTVTALTLRLKPAPRYLKLEFATFKSSAKALAYAQTLLTVRHRTTIEFLELVAYAPNNVILAIARAHDALNPKEDRVKTFRHPWEEPYYLYLLDVSLRAKMPTQHVIPLIDYLFRFEYGSYWNTDYVYALLPWPLTGQTFISRLLLGWALSDSNVRSAEKATDPDGTMWGRLRLQQDLHVPIQNAPKLIDWALNSEAIGVTPLWLLPVLASPQPLLAASLQHKGREKNTEQGYYYLNISLYGRPSRVPFDVEETNVALLEQCYQAGGRTMLHAHNWHDRQLFASMYDNATFEARRHKNDADQHYPQLFDKIALRESEREKLRQRFTGSELAFLKTQAKNIIFNTLQFWK